MTETIKALDEREMLRAILGRACAQHREAVGATLGACGDLLAAAHDVVGKGTEPVVLTDSVDTFAGQLDRLRGAVAILNDRHGLVGVLSELLRTWPDPDATPGGAA